MHLLNYTFVATVPKEITSSICIIRIADYKIKTNLDNIDLSFIFLDLIYAKEMSKKA